MRLPPRFFWLVLSLPLALSLSLLSDSSQANESYRWDSVRIGGGGFVSAIIPSKSEKGLIYARTDVGGAYRWESDSSTWIPLNDWVSRENVGYLGVESLAIDEQNPNWLYLLVGTSYFSDGRTAILRSDDYGATFETIDVTSQFRAHGNGIGRQNGEKLQVDPNNANILYCGTRDHGLFKSLDRGSTWTRLSGLDVTSTDGRNGIAFVILDPDSASAGASQTLFVGVSSSTSHLYRSDDAGQTFTAIPGVPGQMPQRGVLVSGGHLYTTFANGAGPHGDWINTEFTFDLGSIWKLNTQSNSWTNISPAGYTRAIGGISVDPTDPQRLVASTINTWLPQGGGVYGDRFFVSADGGATWTDLVERGFAMDPNGVTWIPGQSIHWAGSIEFDPYDTDTVWITSGNGIYRCDDIDATPSIWKFAVHGLEETVPLGFISMPGRPAISVIGDYEGFLHSDPKLYAPVHRPGIGTTTGLAVASLAPELAYRVGKSVMQRSTDGGSTWSAIPTVNASAANEFGQIAVSADGATLLHSPEGSTTTYRTTDEGSAWTAVSGLSMQAAGPIADPANANVFYAYGGSNLYVSTDAGLNFSAAAALPAGGMNRLATVLGKEGHLWFAHPSEGLYRSTDSGTSFTRLASVQSARAVGSGKAAPGADYPTLFIWGTIGGVEGVFRSTDQGATWIRINDDAHQYGGPGNAHFIVGDQNVFGRVYMSTAGRGIAYGEPVLDSIAYGDWAASAFTASQQNDPTISGTGADPDRDSLNNLLEWILQTDPLEATDLADETFAFSGNAPRIVFQQLAELNTAILSVEVSTDLQNWADITTLFSEAASEQTTNLTRTRVFHPASGSFPHTLFLRVHAQR